MNYSTKKELAMAYCPDIDYTAALKKTQPVDPQQHRTLGTSRRHGLHSHTTPLTPQQVKLLFRYLGEPF